MKECGKMEGKKMTNAVVIDVNNLAQDGHPTSPDPDRDIPDNGEGGATARQPSNINGRGTIPQKSKQIGTNKLPNLTIMQKVTCPIVEGSAMGAQHAES